MEIPKELKSDIDGFCRANNISNIDAFMLKLLKQGFTSEKFGATPITNTVKEKIVEVIVEKVVEKIVEVPVNIENGALNEKYTALLLENEALKNEIEALKKIKKRDIYGE